MQDIDELSWPASRLSEVLETLGRTSGLSSGLVDVSSLPPVLSQQDDEWLAEWIDAAADFLGFEAESAEATYAEVESFIRNAGPALIQLPFKKESRFIALIGSGLRTVRMLCPDLMIRRIPIEMVRSVLCQGLESPLLAEVDRLLDEAAIPKRRRSKTRAVILRDRLNQERISDCWLLRPSPGVSFWFQVRYANLLRRAFTLTGVHTLQYLLWLLSWWIVGKGALQGYLDPGWLLAWVLLLLTLVPLIMLTTWLQGRLAIGLGGLLKQRLLYGALRLEPEEIRHQGVGQLLGRVMETEAIEFLALTGGFLALMAAIELIITVGVLSIGLASQFHAFLLLGWITLTVLLGWRYFKRYRQWAHARIGITHNLVETMVGHRTRLAQEASEFWHESEDQFVNRYLNLSAMMDKRGMQLLAFIPRGWLVLGLLGLSPALVSGGGTPAALAVGLGGVVLAFRALERLTAGLAHLTGAAIAWRQIAPLFQAAARPTVSRAPMITATTNSRLRTPHYQQPFLNAHDLVFRYPHSGKPVLQNCSMHVYPGDRLLLEGPSGSGKSTLSSILTGLRSPQSGVLLIHGLDRQTLGYEGWRKYVAIAPQFHENYVLTETFAFNLLMGRRWPPREEDLCEAEAICRELALGDLLDSMPAGMMQMIGESGWQLSHGERSRLYIARALLQKADLLIFDESFAALDPKTLHQALKCVLNRAPTLLVIAHP